MSSDRILGAARWSVLAASLALGLFSPPALAAEPGVRPNIVFILSDDEDVASHRFMPKTQALLGDRGATFENFFVTYSFCCPSRATILRGQYPHNTGSKASSCRPAGSRSGARSASRTRPSRPGCKRPATTLHSMANT